MTLNTDTLVGDFDNGSTFSYTSVAADGISDLSMVPGGLQLNVQGQNAEGDSLVLSWIVAYTNDCGVTPIFTEGQSIGWTTIVSVLVIARGCSN